MEVASKTRPTGSARCASDRCQIVRRAHPLSDPKYGRGFGRKRDWNPLSARRVQLSLGSTSRHSMRSACKHGVVHRCAPVIDGVLESVLMTQSEPRVSRFNEPLDTGCERRSDPDLTQPRKRGESRTPDVPQTLAGMSLELSWTRPRPRRTRARSALRATAQRAPASKARRPRT